MNCSEFKKGIFSVQKGIRGTKIDVKGIRFKYEPTSHKDLSLFCIIYKDFKKENRARERLYVRSPEVKTMYEELIQTYKVQCAFEPFFVKEEVSVPSFTEEEQSKVQQLQKYIIFVCEPVKQVYDLLT